MSETILVELKKIKPNPFNARREYKPEKVAEIAASIKAHGMLETPSARQVGDQWELVFGHTRLQAYRQLAPEDAKKWGAMEIKPVGPLTDRQMFELGVSENVKRNNLNPIEQARALKLYIEKFKATSKQAGELFNLKPSSVRGKVRLLNLPEDIQEKVVVGDLAESQARKLVNIGRVVNDKDLKSLIEEISEDGNVDHAIASTLRSDEEKNIVSMRDWSGDEGVAGHDLWKMDGSNFPNQLLSPLTIKSLPALIGRELKPAEVPVVETWLSQLAAGAHPDDLINQDPANADLHDLVYHLAAPPTCAQCPFHMRNDGEDWCGMRACYERKEEAFLKQEVAKFSAKLKIPAYDPKVDGATIRKLDGYKAPHQTFFKNRHPLLRIKAGQLRFSKNFGSLPSNIVVVATKGLVEQLVEKRGSSTSSSSGSQQTDYAEEERKQQMERRRRQAVERFLWEHFIPAMVKQLKKFDFLPAMEAIAEGLEEPNLKLSKPKTKNEKLALIRQLIVWTAGPWNLWQLEEQKNAVAAAAKQAVGFARSWGVAMPASFMKEAEKIDAEIVAAETPAEKPAKAKKSTSKKKGKKK